MMVRNLTVDHLHVIVTAILPDGPPVSERDVSNYLYELTEAIGMQILAGPIISRVNDPDNAPGTTGVVLLSTSHASIHTWDVANEFPAYLQADVYSCKRFDPQIIFNLLDLYFKPLIYAFDILDRSPMHAFKPTTN